MAVTVYSTPTCRYCTAAKQYLAKNGVKFRDVDVSRDARAEAEMIRRTGSRAYR